MYRVEHEITNRDSLGQSWIGDDFNERVADCQEETVNDMVYKHIKIRDSVLEAGCGTGRWVAYLMNRGYNIRGIDISEEAVKIGKEHGLPVYKRDVRDTGYPPKMFGAVISLGVVEHFETPREVLKEMKRILSDDGTLIITVPCNNLVRRVLVNHLKTFKKLLRKLIGKKYQFEEWRYTKKEFEQCLRLEGFKVMDRVLWDYYPPMSMGLSVDFPFLRVRDWHLNKLGRFINWLLPKSWTSSGYVWVCKKS